MTWKLPPRIKVYEAIGCLADDRLLVNDTGAIVTSSDGDKTYTVLYDAEQNMIVANDNGSYWQGYLGYPAIAFLFKTGLLQYDPQFAEELKGISWKKINLLHKNNWQKTEEWIYLNRLEHDASKIRSLERFASQVARAIDALSLQQPQKRLRPPVTNKED